MQELCVLILYPAATLNSLIQPSSLLVASLGFSMHSIMSSANSDSFISFPILFLFFFYFFLFLPFISFSPLIAVARTPKTMFKKSGKSRHPCLVHDIR